MGENAASGVLLAGGRSRRMGRDKLPLMVGDRPILRRAYDALAACCDEVIPVIHGSQAPPGLPEGVHPVRDLRSGGDEGLGPLAGIEAGLRHARHRRVFVAAGDMPFLPEDLIRKMLARLAGGALAVVPRNGDRWEPLCAAYDREALVYAGRALDEGVRSLHDFLRSLPRIEEIGEGELRRFGDPETLLMNVNSPEDLARAREVGGG